MPEARDSGNYPARIPLTVLGLLLTAFLLLDLCCFLPETAAASSGAVSDAAAEPVFFDLSVRADHSELLIIFDGKTGGHELYSLENPSRLVIDIFDRRLPEKIVGVPVNRPELLRLQVSQDHRNVRFILELPPSAAIEHQLEKHPSGIKLSLFQPGQRQTGVMPQPPPPLPGGISPRIPGGKGLPPGSHHRESLPESTLAELLGNEKITILFHKVPLAQFFSYVTQKSGVAINHGPELPGSLSLQLIEIPLHEAVQKVMAGYGLTMHRENGELLIRTGEIR